MDTLKILLFILGIPIFAPLLWLSYKVEKYWKEGKKGTWFHYLVLIFIAPVNAFLYVTEEHWEELVD
ncbi:MAG: hypothetical protein AAB944_02140 [Patescibacteria group bacterium]